MKAAKQILNTKYGWYSIGCTAHSLQLCINKGLQVALIKNSLGAAKQLINHFKRSELATSALKKNCEVLQVPFKKLIMDVSTRWNSTYLMIERLAEMELPVLSVLRVEDIIPPSKAKALSLKAADWDVMKRLIPTLEPFYEATDILGVEKFISISLRNPYVKGLKNHVIRKASEESGPVKQFCQKVAEEMTSRFEVIAAGITWKATALDPRYKLKGLISVEAIQLRSALEIDVARIVGVQEQSVSMPQQADVQQSKSSLKSLVDMALESAESSDSSSDAENVRDEISQYFSEKRIPDKENPLKWWARNSGRFPKLAKLAARFLCVPATSTPSERAFSNAGNTATALRTSLTGKHVEALVFLKCNENL